ncbi:MAG: hypothetical protein QXQ87_04630 [Halobacteria archaeon]
MVARAWEIELNGASEEQIESVREMLWEWIETVPHEDDGEGDGTTYRFYHEGFYDYDIRPVLRDVRDALKEEGIKGAVRFGESEEIKLVELD